jgi:ATP-dependent phosphofructokinase / diphosphate-dependent phosphofructokinase
MARDSKRLGILTGGGDCPGLNAVIRAVTKSACRAGWEVRGILDGYAGLLEGRYCTLDNDAVSNILTLGGTILGTSNRADPFAVVVGGKKVDQSDVVMRQMEQWGLHCLVTIGGDGTQFIANRLSQKGVRVVGVPKTIDNDLEGTDVTFGHDTAVFNATEAIDKLHTTAQSHHRVMIVEVMGRYAGWLALSCGIAGGGDIILIPEIPFTIDAVTKAIQERRSQGKTFSIIVAAEGAKMEGGKMIVRQRVKDSPDPIRLGGIGNWLADQLRGHLTAEVRVTVLGHVLRGGVPTAFDRILASRFGARAFHCVQSGHFGKLVALRGKDIVHVPLSKAASKLKLVPLEHPLLKTALQVGTSFGK